jgi:hypothetical protein
MSSKEVTVESLRLTPKQQELVRDALRALLDSSQFRRSKRYPAFLEFVVLNTLAGHADHLKERVVADEVFGRSGDYDPSNDPIVRYTAGEVRKRMALYFSEHPEAPVRIDLPTGGYTAEFHFRVPATDESTRNESNPGVNSRVLGSGRQNARAKRTRPRNYLWLGGCVAAALVLIFGVAAFWMHSSNRAKREFWWPVLHNSSPAVVVVGAGGTLIPNQGSQAQSAGTAQPGQSQIATFDENSLVLGNAVAVTLVCNSFRNYGHECKVLPSQSAPFTELHNNSVVLIGAFDNALTTRFLSTLRYQFVSHSSTSDNVLLSRGITDNANPGATPKWGVPNARQDGPSGVDYAIVARFHSDITDGMVVVLAGVGPQGTHGAGDFVSPPGTEAMREIAARAPGNWAGINFEAVLQIDLVQGNPGHVKVIATQYW